jgi:hypothetical protein
MSFRGHLVATSVSDPVVALTRVAAHLRVDGIERYELTGDQLTFQVGFFAGPGRHHPLAMITHAAISANPSPAGVHLHFRLSYIQAFWIVTAMVLGVPGPFVLSSTGARWGQGVSILAGFWLWLYGVNLVVSLVRFRRWLAAAVNRESAESAHPKTLFGSRLLAQFLYHRRRSD